DAIVVNRILPGVESDGNGNSWVSTPSQDPYLQHLQEIQARYLGEIERDFYPLPIMRSGWFDQEMVGLKALDALAARLFSERDPGDVFFVGQTQTIEEDGKDFVLSLPLPHVEL